MTTVSADAARPIGADSFADLPGLAEAAASVAVVDGKVAVTFDAELTEAQVVAVRDRMTSRDDADQADRAKIAAALNGGATNLTQMLAERELGLPVRDPIYPAAAKFAASKSRNK